MKKATAVIVCACAAMLAILVYDVTHPQEPATVTEVQFCEQAPPEEFTDNCILFKDRMVREIERAHVAEDKWQEILDGCVSKALCCYQRDDAFVKRRMRCKQFLSGDWGYMSKQCVAFLDGPEGR